jgi:hypothetical protein
MLNQFLRNFRHVSRLPCKDAPIFLEEFDEREFLFGVQIVAYVSNFGRLLCGQWDCLLSESFEWMDVLEVLALGMIRFGGGGGGTRPKPASSLGILETP